MRLLFIGLLVLLGLNLDAQLHQSIFMSDSGNVLLNRLDSAFSPRFVLSYDDARDTLYGKIDLQGDSLFCIYTGYGIKMQAGEDPSQYAFTQGINAEHSWPRSAGADIGNAFSDMHHLFPTWVEVNTARGSLPYSEINDNQTDRWYFKNSINSRIPSQNIDAYSELLLNTAFEPREGVKGDIARAQFYLYTVYPASLDSSYFNQIKSDICQWHIDDPVDQLEWDRSFAISKYQDGKPNPFVLDCTLAHRTYCKEIDACEPPVSIAQQQLSEYKVTLYPNPASHTLYIEYDEEVLHSDEVEVIVTDLSSRKVLQKRVNRSQSYINIRHLNPGLYICQIRLNSSKTKQVSRHKVLITR